MCGSYGHAWSARWIVCWVHCLVSGWSAVQVGGLPVEVLVRRMEVQVLFRRVISKVVILLGGQVGWTF